jgi:hypothetical protein
MDSTAARDAAGCRGALWRPVAISGIVGRQRPSVKQLFDYVVGYFREDFHLGYYTTIGLFLLAAFSLNFSAHFKRAILNPTLHSPVGIVYFCLFYGCAYYFAAFAWAYFHRDGRLLRSRSFWAISAFVIGSMALDNYSVNLPGRLVSALGTPAPVQYWAERCLWNLDRMVTIAVPVVVFRRFVDRRPGAFYGLTLAGFDWRPYATMLLVMVPLIAWASFQPSFLGVYPSYRPGSAEAFLSLSQRATFGTYETTYALRYVSIELFFRGLLVIGLEKHMGRAVLMPMVTLYAFWHFGKPIPEAIGSIFAGYVLGVFALRTRSIVGGIIVHVGVAVAMDLAAYLQTY